MSMTSRVGRNGGVVGYEEGIEPMIGMACDGGNVLRLSVCGVVESLAKYQGQSVEEWVLEKLRVGFECDMDEVVMDVDGRRSLGERIGSLERLECGERLKFVKGVRVYGKKFYASWFGRGKAS